MEAPPFVCPRSSEIANRARLIRHARRDAIVRKIQSYWKRRPMCVAQNIAGSISSFVETSLEQRNRRQANCDPRRASAQAVVCRA